MKNAGVAQKERLKEMQTRGRPYPVRYPDSRTLHMAMVGVGYEHQSSRGRYPIRTYVVEYDEQIIQQAIRRAGRAASVLRV